MTITLPKLLSPNSGLKKIEGLYYAKYRQDGKVRTVSLKTDNPAVARSRRDKLHARAIQHGAAYANSAKDPAAHDRYVYKQKPYYVKVRGKVVGHYDTAEEAAAARDAYLANLETV